jgi:hypothetical protein
MKKLLVTIAAVLVSVSAFAQGTVTVGNRNLTTGGNQPITLPNGDGPGLSGGQAQLYVLQGTTYTAVGAPINFRSTSAAAAPFLEVVPDVVIPGVPPGSPATVQLRAWVGGASYDAATQFKGSSADIHLAQLGGDPGTGAPPITPPDLSGLTGFQLQPVVPEPSTIALAVLGASALFIRRRK